MLVESTKKWVASEEGKRAIEKALDNASESIKKLTAARKLDSRLIGNVDNYGFLNNYAYPNNTFLADDYGIMQVDKNESFKLNKEEDMTLREKVEEVVNDFCDRVVSFTSLDVSNKVKEDFPTTRHREIATIVRQLASDGHLEELDYQRAMISVSLPNNTTATAALYYHYTIDPDNYDRRSQVPIPVARQTLTDATSNARPRRNIADLTPRRPQRLADIINSINDGSNSQAPAQTSQASVQVLNSTPAPFIGLTITRQQKGDCRLEVPATWVRLLGWQESDRIFAQIETDGCFVLVPYSRLDDNHDLIGSTMINDGRLRVTKRIMNHPRHTLVSRVGQTHMLTLLAHGIQVG